MPPNMIEPIVPIVQPSGTSQPMVPHPMVSTSLTAREVISMNTAIQPPEVLAKLGISAM